MPDTDLPGKRTATRDGYQANAAVQVRVEQFDVHIDAGDFVMVMSADMARALAQNLITAALTAERNRKDHEPPEKAAWIPGGSHE